MLVESVSDVSCDVAWRPLGAAALLPRANVSVDYPDESDKVTAGAT